MLERAAQEDVVGAQEAEAVEWRAGKVVCDFAPELARQHRVDVGVGGEGEVGLFFRHWMGVYEGAALWG